MASKESKELKKELLEWGNNLQGAFEKFRKRMAEIEED